MKLLTMGSAIFDRITRLLALLGASLLIIMMLAVCWEVISRYFLGRGIVWVIEFSEYNLLYITFLGTAWLLGREGHVKMDIVLTRLNPRNQSLVNSITSILGAVLCLVIAWSGAEVSWDHLQRGLHQPTLIAPPDFPIFVIIPVGSFLLFIQFLRRSYSFLESWRASADRAQRV